MSLFCKHIWRTVKRSPLQPLLILLTLILSVAVAVTSFRFQDVFLAQAEANEARFTAAGDILITPTQSSSIRLLFSEDACEIVGKRGNVVGEYSLTFFKQTESGNHLLSASAVDLEEADAFYDFSYVAYGVFTTKNLSDSAVITTDLANKYGLTVGDELKVTLFGEKLEYTVQAIAQPTGLLSERDILVSKDALMKLLSYHIPMIGTLQDAFDPCNRLMIRANEDSNLNEIAKDLQQADIFSDYSVEMPYDQSQTDFFATFQTMMVSLLGALILLLSVLLIMGAMSLLHMQRQNEYALFALAGASFGQRSALLFWETAAYALVGGIIGTALAQPMLHYAAGFFSWSQHDVHIGIAGQIFGIAFAFVMMGICTAWQCLKNKNISPLACLTEKTAKAAKPKKLTATCLPIAAIVLICGILIPCLPVKWQYIPAVSAAFCLILLFFFIAPTLIQAISALIEKRLSKCNRPNVALLLSGKSLKNNPGMQHVGRLLTVLFAIVMTITVCHRTVDSQNDIFENALNGEVTAVNLSSKAEKQLKSSDLPMQYCTFSMITSVELPNGYSAFAIAFSGDAEACLHPGLIPDHRPEKGEIVLSEGIAALLDLQIGDTAEIQLQGIRQPFLVAGIQHVNTNFIFLNADSIDSANEFTNIKLDDGQDEQTKEKLIEILETNSISLIDKQEIVGSVPSTLRGFLDLSSATVITVAIISLLGCTTLLSQQYRLRKRERELLRQSGATSLDVLCIYLTEISLLLITSLLLALICAAAMAILLHIGLRSFGFLLL